MMQMANYMGEGVYIVISLVDSKEWQKAFSKKPANISRITGASVSGGDRSITILEIDHSNINKGFSLRFESALEECFFCCQIRYE
jgi:hypothetical protein